MIHVLGAGNIGSLFAVSLARKYPVQFILRPSSLKHYINCSNSTVRIRTDKGGAEWEQPIPGTSMENIKEPLSQVIVTVKTPDIKSALLSVKDAITPASEVLILHNGMGVKEQLEKIWPREDRRPVIGFGITDAGVKRRDPQWTFDYTGNGTCTFFMPTRKSQIGDMLQSSSELIVSERVPLDVFELQQKKKLVVNSVINPLTAILQCHNGALLTPDIYSASEGLMQKIVNESSRILELNRYEMWDLVVDVANRTSSNTSSMLRDVDQGRTSEIDFINGYIVDEAKRQGLHAPLNLMLKSLVKMRTMQARHEEEHTVPLMLDQH